MRYLISFLVCMACVLGPTGVASAALIERDWLAPGDGLLTLDTATNLEWLDVSQTGLALFPGVLLEDRYQAVVAETAPGGMFAGFGPASPDQALALAVNAGITLGTDDFATNSAPATALIDLVGFTQLANHGGLELFAPLDAIGFDTVGRPRRRMLWVHHKPEFPPSPFPPTAGAFLLNGIFLTSPYPPGDGAMAVLLVREVPEPCTSFLTSLGLVFVGRLRRRSVPNRLRA